MLATGFATWEGTWKEGHGQLSTKTETVRSADYSFASRFEGAAGASPEELLAAGHAGCFNQALANNFGMIGLEATSIKTSVEIDLGYGEDSHPAIKGSRITTEAIVPGITQEQFEHCAERSRANCTFSKIMKCEITLVATLSGAA